jgi:hypothetical protein
MGADLSRRTAELTRAVTDVLVGAPRFATAPLIRRWHLRWGAADAEVAAPMPGDELVKQPSFNATRAITIDAPREAVWPWIVQLGFGHAGWYSYDLFDNAARPSAERILPEYQQPTMGDWVPMASKVNETTAFKITGLERNQWMLWQKPHSTWVWKLVPLDGGRTRLITRLKARYAWRSTRGNALLTLILFEFGDFPMMRKLLLGVKRRAEHTAADAPSTTAPRLARPRRSSGTRHAERACVHGGDQPDSHHRISTSWCVKLNVAGRSYAAPLTAPARKSAPSGWAAVQRSGKRVQDFPGERAGRMNVGR